MKKVDVKERVKIALENKEAIGINQACKLLGLSKSTLYYKPKEKDEYELLIINLLDRFHTSFPTYGSRRLKVEINNVLNDLKLPVVNRKRIQHYMKILMIEVIYQKPNLSKLGRVEYKYPYLLKNLVINKSNMVWSSDITYIPFQGGFVYLFGIIDWYSRTIIDYEVSTSLTNDFVINTIERAFQRYGKPRIMNSDQGAHYTSKEYIALLKTNKVKISMDGKDRALDNILIERFWRTIKYEYLFLRSFENIRELEISVYNAVHHYNYYRPHQSLEYQYPMQVYSPKIYESEKDKYNYNLSEPEYCIHQEIKEEINSGFFKKIVKKYERKMKLKARVKKTGRIFN